MLLICFPSVFVTCRGCMFSLALILHLLLDLIVNLLFCFDFKVIVVVFSFTSIILFFFFFLLTLPLLPELCIYNFTPLVAPPVTITLQRTQDVALPSAVPSLTDATTDHVASSPAERNGPVPSAPRDVVASLVSTRFIKLTWRLPAEPHGENITYSVFYGLEGTNRLKMLKDVNVCLLSYIVLKNSLRYLCRLNRQQTVTLS